MTKKPSWTERNPEVVAKLQGIWDGIFFVIIMVGAVLILSGLYSHGLLNAPEAVTGGVSIFISDGALYILVQRRDEDMNKLLAAILKSNEALTSAVKELSEISKEASKISKEVGETNKLLRDELILMREARAKENESKSD